MQENINFGIDLGTTNSAIGYYSNGKVNVLKNPKGFKEILPSAIAFRKGKMLIGDKAIEQLAANAENVFTSFKRNMGTNYIYTVETETLSPVDLSKFILQELLGFVQEQKVTAAVITIPASFDSVQSNATKKAGLEAGMQEVVLLQEPVAACLAYANENNLDIDSKQTWLVYDFGGGTFDSAIVEIDRREMKVKDHLGNNFLGGIDIDNAILKQIVLPKVKAQTGIDILMTNDSHEYLMLRQHLLYLIEEAKKELSISTVSNLEIDFADLGLLCDISISRDEFDKAISPVFQESATLLNELLSINNLSFKDINRIVLVGGTTYIPLIRDGLKKLSGTSVDSSIDPTTAIVKGAAYFAGTKQKQNIVAIENDEDLGEKIDVRLAFENTTNDDEELITLKSEGNFKGSFIINKNDGSYDSGLQIFKNEASIFVPIQAKQINNFKIVLYDKRQRIVFKRDISISHGLYSISGQTVPMDICLEVDADDGTSYLEPIFKKNSILPLKQTVYKTLSKSVSAGADDSIFINVLEGKRGTMPASNLSIGFIAINGKQMANDLIKGTDIELNFAMSESRDLQIEVYIPSADLVLKETFNPHTKIVLLDKLNIDINNALIIVSTEIRDSTLSEQYELAARFKKILEQLYLLKEELTENQTELLYKTDEKKRVLLKELDSINRSKHIYEELVAFKKAKNELLVLLAHAKLEQAEQAKRILDEEKEIINSGDKHLIKNATKKIESLNSTLFYQHDENFIELYFSLKAFEPNDFKNYQRVEELFVEGDILLLNKNYVALKGICFVILGQIKEEKRASKNQIFGSLTGLK
jgi:molecular chaperone DnaK